VSEPDREPPSALEGAFAVVRDSRRQVRVHLRGTSALASALVDTLAAADGDTLILRSPHTPGAGFDVFEAGMEALASVVEPEGSITIADRGDPDPHIGAAALSRLFPGLSEALAPGSTTAGQPGVAPIVRQLGFEALHAHLVELARARPTVLWLRDLDRGNEDSLALLRELTTDSPRHQRVPLLLLLDCEPHLPSTPMQAWLAADLAEGDPEPHPAHPDHPAGPATDPGHPASAVTPYVAPVPNPAEPEGDAAHARLAFAHARDLYRAAVAQARAADPDATQRHAALLIKLGDALEDNGQRLDAASRYREASDLLDAPLDDPRVCALRLRAASMAIADGRLGEGWRQIETLLRAFEIQIPSSAAEALLRANWRRGRILLRRDLERPAGEPLDAHERARLDLLWFTSTRLAVVSRALSDALRTIHLDAVTHSGDDSSRIRALAYEIAVESHVGPPFEATVKRLLEACAVLCARTEDTRDEAWHQCALAANEFSHGRWRRCAAACERASALLALHPHVDWERSIIHSYHWFSLAWMGELGELQTRLTRAATLAEARDEPFNSIEVYAGQPMLAWLAAGRGGLARSRSEAACRRVSASPGATWPESSYRRQHYCDLVALVHAALYIGDACPAWTAIVGQWRELELAYFVSMRTVGLELRHARARTALALAEQLCGPTSARCRAQLDAAPGDIGEHWDRPRLFADVRRQLEAFRRDKACFAPAMANLVEAGLLNLEGDQSAARHHLDEAVRGFSAVDMLLHRECARAALGACIGGDEGAQVTARAEAWMREQGIVDPLAMARSQAAGFSLRPRALDRESADPARDDLRPSFLEFPAEA